MPRKVSQKKKSEDQRPGFLKFRVRETISSICHGAENFTVENGVVFLPSTEQRWYRPLIEAGILVEE